MKYKIRAVEISVDQVVNKITTVEIKSGTNVFKYIPICYQRVVKDANEQIMKLQAISAALIGGKLNHLTDEFFKHVNELTYVNDDSIVLLVPESIIDDPSCTDFLIVAEII